MERWKSGKFSIFQYWIFVFLNLAIEIWVFVVMEIWLMCYWNMGHVAIEIWGHVDIEIWGYVMEIWGHVAIEIWGYAMEIWGHVAIEIWGNMGSCCYWNMGLCYIGNGVQNMVSKWGHVVVDMVFEYGVMFWKYGVMWNMGSCWKLLTYMFTFLFLHMGSCYKQIWGMIWVIASLVLFVLLQMWLTILIIGVVGAGNPHSISLKKEGLAAIALRKA